jgi:hypothetical protein
MAAPSASSSRSEREPEGVGTRKASDNRSHKASISRRFNPFRALGGEIKAGSDELSSAQLDKVLQAVGGMIRESCVDPDMPNDVITIIDDAQAKAWAEVCDQIRDNLMQQKELEPEGEFDVRCNARSNARSNAKSVQRGHAGILPWFLRASAFASRSPQRTISMFRAPPPSWKRHPLIWLRAKVQHTLTALRQLLTPPSSLLTPLPSHVH